MERLYYIGRALPPSDPTLPPKGVFLSPFTLQTDLQRQIEQAGTGYEKLKRRVSKQISFYLSRDEESKSAKYESSEEEEAEADKEEHKDWEKKRKKRTRAEVEKEALLMGDLYAVLDLKHLMFEAGEKDIKSAYRKMALEYHPDKSTEEQSASDKELWLQI